VEPSAGGGAGVADGRAGDRFDAGHAVRVRRSGSARKLPNGTGHRCLYAGDRLVELRVGSTVHQQFVWAPQGVGYVDELVQVSLNQDPGDSSENQCERHFYALADANYNVLGMVNAAGNLVERYSYTPYGQRTVFSHGWSARPIGPGVTGDGVF
jgi:hypothetical protein